MIPFKLYIDLSGGKNPDGYFEVNAVSVGAFKDDQIDGMVVKRKSWGDVRIKNEPFQYAKLGGDRYKLYDIISSQRPNQEIHIKFVSAYETVYGYFGIVDCKIDDDHKVLSINVTTLDQYTNFIENRDEEIKLFDEGNIIVNGKFDTWNEGMPIGWERLNSDSVMLNLEQKYVLDKSAIGISDYGYLSENARYSGQWNASTGNFPTGDLYEGMYVVAGVAGTVNSIYYAVGDAAIYNGTEWLPYLALMTFPTNSLGIDQYKANVLKDSLCNVTMFYAVTGTSENKKYVYCDLLLSDSGSSDVYRLLENGTWTKDLVNTTKLLVTNKNKRVCIPIDELNAYYNFTVAAQRTPVSGTLKFVIYRPENAEIPDDWDFGCKLIVPEVIVSVTAIELKTIKLRFDSENLVTFPQSELSWLGKMPDDYIFRRYSRSDWDYNKVLSNFFNGDGSPKINAIPATSSKSETYSDLLRAFEDYTHESYKFEISKITLYKGEYPRVYASAYFSREQIYKTPELYTQADFDNNICEELEIGTEIPPERNVGWSQTGRLNTSGQMLWCRTPFNNSIKTWSLENINTSPKLRSFGGVKYYDSLTSTKQYPTKQGSDIKIENGIDFRELIRQVYTKTHSSLLGKNVYSNFFWNDALTEEETKNVYVGNPVTCNYVTMSDRTDDTEALNVLNKILAVHTYEFIPSENRTTNDDEKSVLKTSAKKLFDDILIMFPGVYWFIDDNGDLHFEHVKYFDRTKAAKDLTKPKYELKNYQEWDYLKDKMFSKSEYETKNSGYLDFNKSVVSFDKISSNKRGEDIKGTYNTQVLSTDVQYCAENPTSIENGIVLIAYTTNNNVNYAKYGTGQYSGKIVINGDLSLSTLLQQYGTYEGTWTEGLINGKGNNPYGKQTFYNTIRCRQGKEIEVKGIVLDDIVYTKLGLGLVKSRTIDYNRENTKINAIYRHSDRFLNIDLGGGDVIEPEIPSLGIVANPITNIAQTTVTFNGNVTSDGGKPVTERGFIYGTEPNLSLTSGTKVVSGSGTGLHSANVTGLTVNTNYFVLEYATNAKGTVYGKYQYSFKTAQIEPSVITMFLGFDLLMRAEIMGDVVSDGGMALERGVFWATHPNVTKSDTFIFKDIAGVGDYQVLLTVENGTTYYARAAVTPDFGLTWYLGNEISFDAQW